MKETVGSYFMTLATEVHDDESEDLSLPFEAQYISLLLDLQNHRQRPHPTDQPPRQRSLLSRHKKSARCPNPAVSERFILYWVYK